MAENLLEEVGNIAQEVAQLASGVSNTGAVSVPVSGQEIPTPINVGQKTAKTIGTIGNIASLAQIGISIASAHQDGATEAAEFAGLATILFGAIGRHAAAGANASPSSVLGGGPPNSGSGA